MAWIETVPFAEATGLLRRLYDAAIERAGKVFRVIEVQSPRPHVLRLSTQLYMEVMRSPRSGLTRAQREMIAVTVSRANDCFYWTQAHADDLRDEVKDHEAAAALVEAVRRDHREGPLTDADVAMLDFAEKLTRAPSSIRASDIDALRAHGFSDAAVHDIVQVTALFNYYNRLADGLGIASEPEWDASAQ